MKNLKTDPSWEGARQDAVQAALEAWQAIATLYHEARRAAAPMGSASAPSLQERATPEGPTTEADKLADDAITRFLRSRYPPDRFGLLTEESEDNRDRLDRTSVWIVDPIDGTTEFIKKSGNFTIQLGLVERTDGGLYLPRAAAVFMPLWGEMHSAAKGGGSFVQKVDSGGDLGQAQPLAVSRRARFEEMSAVKSASHRTAELERLMASIPFRTVKSIGSLGVKICLVAVGKFDFYANTARGRAKEWDVCAPELILTESGGKLTDLRGDIIDYNRPDVYIRTGLLATNGAIHDRCIETVAAFESSARAE